MTIDRIRTNSANLDRTETVSGKEIDQAGNASDAQQGNSEDSLSVSSKTKEINRIVSAVEQSRIDRLNEVKKALDAGKYQVSAEDIARALIDSNKLIDNKKL